LPAWKLAWATSVVVGGELIPNAVPAATEVATKLKDADAVLIMHLSFGSSEPLLKLVEAGLPSAIFSQPFSGHDWMYVLVGKRPVRGSSW